MAYRNPLYGFLHAAADAGVGAITSAHAFAADFPEDHLVDRRPSALATFASSQSDHHVTLDRGAGSLEAVDRLVIPAGHNLATATGLVVKASATGAFSGEESVIGALVGSPGSGVVDVALGSSTARHLRLEIQGSGAWSLGQLWYTRRRAMAEAAPATPWDQPILVPAQVRQTPTRLAASILGAPRRRFRFRYEAVAGGDEDLLEELQAATSSGLLAFWIWPPESSDAPLLVQDGAGRGPAEWPREQDHPGVAQFGPSYTWDLDLVEVTA